MALTVQSLTDAYVAWTETGSSEMAALCSPDSYDNVSRTHGVGVFDVVGAWLAASFDDRRVQVHATAQDGDRILVWMTMSGVHVGNGFPRLAGLPVESRRVSWSQFHAFRVEDDRVVEHWAVRDDYALIEEIRASTR